MTSTNTGQQQAKSMLQDSARFTRIQRDGAEIAKSIKGIGSNTNKIAEAERSPAEKALFDSYDGTKLTGSHYAKREIKKELEETKLNKENKKAFLQEQIKVADKYAQGIAAQLIISLEPDALKFFRKKDGEKFANLSPEEFEAQVDKALEDPDQIPEILKNVISSDVKAKLKEFEDDPDKLEELYAREAQLAPIFHALEALKNDDHLEMFNVISSISSSQLKEIGGNSLKGLVSDYKESLVDIGRRHKEYLGLTAQHEKNFLRVAKELDPKIDKHEFKNLYARVGGVIASRNGGISGAGGVFNFEEGDIAQGMDSFEYKDGSTNLDVRRLVSPRLQPAQYRHYVGVALGEDKVNSKGEVTKVNSVPSYVYVDTEIALKEPPKFDIINGDVPGGGQAVTG